MRSKYLIITVKLKMMQITFRITYSSKYKNVDIRTFTKSACLNGLKRQNPALFVGWIPNSQILNEI